TLQGAVTGNSQNITGLGTLGAANINAHTLQGAITGNNQNITGLGTLGATNITAFTLQGDVTGNTYDITGLGTLGATNINAHTLQGAITGNSQNIVGVGNVSLVKMISSNSVAITSATPVAANNVVLVASGTAAAGQQLFQVKGNGDVAVGTATVSDSTLPDLTVTGSSFFGAGGSYKVTNTGQTTLNVINTPKIVGTQPASTGTELDFQVTNNANSSFLWWNGTTNLMRLDNGGQLTTDAGMVPNGSPDLAEFIQADKDVEAYDLVSLAENNGVPMGGQWEDKARVEKTKTPYDARILGVISDGSSALLVNSHMKGLDRKHPGKPLVLAGRVPIKVCLENGPIKKGDYLTSSSKPGYAMKATEPGATVGIALEDFDGASGKTGKVLCFVDIGERNLTQVVRELKSRSEALERENQALRTRLDGLSDLDALKSQLINLQMRLEHMEQRNRKGGPRLTNMNESSGGKH
ncbi:MAG TPA: hypothetical protein P5079_11245, partial [Elusimicrobiota bacterium]|nr:hypothetical protein [Elusimicrobiota bacterium]